jgi:hypothetical protein
MPRILPVPPLGSFEFSSESLPEEVCYSEAFSIGVDFSFLPEVDFYPPQLPVMMSSNTIMSPVMSPL